jgi:DHA2 family multidrug resistance protein
MSVMIGPTIGPTLGGYLTDNLGWRSIFNINLPIGIVVAMLSYALVEDVGFDPANPKPKLEAGQPKPKRQRTPIDVVGILLLVTSVGSIQYFLERGNADDWFSSIWIVITCFTGFGGLIALIWWELAYAKHPILALQHFANKTFRYGVMLMFGLGAMLYGLIFLLPVFTSTVLNFNATQTGELFIPGALASAAMMPIIGTQLRKRDPRILIFIGIALLDAAFVMISFFDIRTSAYGMFWPLLLRGVAMAYLFVPINSSVLSQFSGVAIGQAAGMLNLLRQIGGSVSIAALATLFAHFNAQNYATLSEKITPFNPITASQRSTIISSMHAKLPVNVGMPTETTSMATTAVKVFYGQVKAQAFILGFQRLLRVAAALFLIMFIPLVLMKVNRGPPNKPQAPPQVPNEEVVGAH